MHDAQQFLQSPTLPHREQSSLFNSHLTENSVSYAKTNNSRILKCKWICMYNGCYLHTILTKIQICQNTFIKILNFTKIRPAGLELFHANCGKERQGRTDRRKDVEKNMAKLTVDFCKCFPKASTQVNINLDYSYKIVNSRTLISKNRS
jgi:hypothetical protein